jgi:hypothetical protein
MLFSRKCEWCREKIPKGSGIRKEVEVYTLVGLHKRNFCSEECLGKYQKRTAFLIKTRTKKGVCMQCVASGHG